MVVSFGYSDQPRSPVENIKPVKQSQTILHGHNFILQPDKFLYKVQLFWPI